MCGGRDDDVERMLIVAGLMQGCEAGRGRGADSSLQVHKKCTSGCSVAVAPNTQELEVIDTSANSTEET